MFSVHSRNPVPEFITCFKILVTGVRLALITEHVVPKRYDRHIFLLTT